MSNPQPTEESGGFGLNDVIYVVFKHKWKIILAAVVGLVGAAVVQFFPSSPIYESEAKLLVRYIVETSTLDSVEAQSRSQGNRTSESILNAELAILTSWDIAVQTVDTVGVETLSRGLGRVLEKGEAAAMILEHLTAMALKGSDVIAVAYRHGDPAVATQVLSSVVEHYLKKHMEVHRGILAIDFVEQRTDQVRSRLTQTEQELQRLKTQSGIISVDSASAALDAAVSRSEESLYAAETELVEQQARVNEMERLFGVEQTSPSTAEASDKVEQETPAPNVQQVEQYRLLVARLRQLRAAEMDLLSRYRAEHPDVKRVRSEIGSLDRSRDDMEARFPNLTHAAPASATGKSPEADLATERKRFAAAEAKVQLLKERLKSALEARKQFAEVAPQITELERTKGLEETAYTYMAGRLERARVDRALDPSNIENIMPVQRPTPAVRVISNRKKVVVGLAGGGIAFGLALAIALEVFVNRTVKRRAELEALLHTPALLAIPQLKGRSSKSVTGCSGDDVEAPSNSIAPWDGKHDVYPYAEAIRDRLNIYFDVNNLKHKPKLIAVTGFAEGDGASTVAASLAAALSEAADGKVLLVDLNTSRADAHPFFGGRPVSAGDEQSPEAVTAPEHFFLASPSSLNSDEAQNGTRRFHELMPKLRASHFDYIVFDMPALEVAHPAVALSRYMDKVLLVIGAERHNPEALKRRYMEIVAARANVSCIFNRVPSYAPAWALHEA